MTSQPAEHVAQIVSVQGAVIRPAVVTDGTAIAALIGAHAQRGEMLPKSKYQVYQHIGDSVFAEMDGKIVGCGVLHVLWEDLAEIRSLVVLEPYRRHGLGTKIVLHLIQEARLLGLSQVFALTYVPEFFKALGFHRIDKRTLPQKIWIDCINCAKFPDCDEEALLLNLEE